MISFNMGRSIECCNQEMSPEIEMFNGGIMYYCCGEGYNHDEFESFDDDDLAYIRKMLKQYKKIEPFTEEQMIELRNIYLYRKVNPHFNTLYHGKPETKF